jgi:hypothetical protein
MAELVQRHPDCFGPLFPPTTPEDHIAYLEKRM